MGICPRRRSGVSERFILAFHPADEEAPTSVRTFERNEAIDRARHLNAIRSDIGWPGMWKVHEMSEGIEP